MRRGSTCKGKHSSRPFPFSDLSATKLRPAAVLADAGRGDYVLCQITSNPYGDPHAVEVAQADLARGSLNLTSYARPVRLFTASDELIRREVATLAPAVLDRIVDAAVRILRGSK